VDSDAVLGFMRGHLADKLQGPSAKEKKKRAAVRALVEEALVDSRDRLLLPSLKRELRGRLTEQAGQHAISVFARNVETVLVAPPIRYWRHIILLAIQAAASLFNGGFPTQGQDDTGNRSWVSVGLQTGRNQRGSFAPPSAWLLM
jgi:hypothetical protein